MLDGLLGKGYSSKCKSSIKATRTRIEALRRRTEAKQRFLREDLAKLLANGLDIDAYGRTEEFLAGQSLLSCYDFIEHAGEYLLKQLSSMQKQSECPEECREAVASLMFAAARFSDLPELRDLRDIFQERYGNSLEHFVNPKFVDKLSARPSKMENRLNLLRDIGLEFSINWDSEGFEKRMTNPSAITQDQPTKFKPPRTTDDSYKLLKGKDSVPRIEKNGASSKERHELGINGHKMHSGRESHGLKRDDVNKPKSYYTREETTRRGSKFHIPYQERQDLTPDKLEFSYPKEDASLKKVRSATSSHGGYNMQIERSSISPLHRVKSESASSRVGSEQNVFNSTRNILDNETEGVKSYSINAIPPPYVKPKNNVLPPPYTKLKDGNFGSSLVSTHGGADSDGSTIGPSPPSRADRNEDEGQVLVPISENGHGCEKDEILRNDIPLPKPRSIRRKHSKSSSSKDEVRNHEDYGVARGSSSSRRRDHLKKGLQILFDDEHSIKDEEERMIDKLLLHYSKKPSNYEVGKLRKKSQAHPLHQKGAAEAGQSSHNESREERNVEPEIVPPPTRSVSLPHEETGQSKATKIFARANSFQLDKQAPHVHPKLPDYDDLAARFASLRGR